MKRLILIICLIILIAVNIDNIVCFIIDYYNIIMEDMNDDMFNSLNLDYESED